MFRILGRKTSINVRKVIWTAAEIGLDFDREDQWGSTASVKSDEFLRLNPNGLVPVIEDEQGVLWESNTICRYLATKHVRANLLPNEPFSRAQVEKWMDWQATALNTSWRHAFMWLVRQDPEFEHPAEVDKSITRWNDNMLLVEAELSDGRPHIVGDQFTLADIVLGLSTQRWKLTPMHRPDTPKVDAYAKRLAERPAARSWMPRNVP